MKRLSLIFTLVFLVSAFLTSNAQWDYDLQFNKDGTFKIVQFTDIHHKPGAPESAPSIELIKYILETEKPDLVVYTGDAVTGRPAVQGWKNVLAPVIEGGFKFAVTLGNHDDEQELTREQIRNMLKDYPGYLGKFPIFASDYGDYVLEVKADKKEENALLYFLDSNAYSTLKNVKGWGWFYHEQVDWYRKTSQKLALPNGEKLNALAYFHIALPEYREAFNSDAKRTGPRNEDECPPNINTGMFAALRLEGDVMGTFVGHDHTNDYLVPFYGIALTYGRWSGGKTTYGHLQHGSRVVVLEKGKRQFKTWMRLRDGQIVDELVFPDGLE